MQFMEINQITSIIEIYILLLEKNIIYNHHIIISISIIISIQVVDQLPVEVNIS